MKSAESIREYYLSFKNGVSPILNKRVTKFPGFKTFVALRKFAFPSSCSDGEGQNGSLEFDKAADSKVTLTENQLTEITDLMKPDLRQKIREIADLKVIHVVLFVLLTW